MFNFDHSSDFKIRSSPRFEKTSFCRYPVNLLRQPFPRMRRRIMAGRYPNVGFRPIGQPVFRPDCPSPRVTVPERYPVLPYSAPRIASPPVMERPPFPNAPPSIPLDQSQHLAKPTLMNYPNNQTHSESTKCVPQMSELNSFSNLWIETVAPSGRKYYYNARTRATTWVRPMHAQIIELNDIKRLQNCSGLVCPQNSPKGNLNHFTQHQPLSPYGNLFCPGNIPLPPRFMVFPQPQNVCKSPQIFPISASEHAQCNPCYQFNPIVPPPNLPFPVLNENQLPNRETVNFSKNVISAEANKYSTETSLSFSTNNEFSGNETKITDWSISNSETSLCAQNGVDQGNISNIEQSDVKEIFCDSQNYTDQNVDQKSNPGLLAIDKQENSDKTLSGEAESKSSEQSVERKKEDANKKEKRISSTRIPGTNWYIMSSKDGKVYYYDSERNISVWEKPSELGNIYELNKQAGIIEDDAEKKQINLGNTCELNKQADIIGEDAKKEQINLCESDNCKSESDSKDSKPKESSTNEPKESSTNEDESLASEQREESKIEQVDKTRPVSSTPIFGTPWHVVWTGDKRVFYHDSQHKISVWKRPVELENRYDVDRLTQIFPLSEDLKSLKKEVRKIDSVGSDTVKKMKKEDGKNDAELNENGKNKNSLIEKKKMDEIPHEQRVKIFYEMLTEKNVSAFSTWEKELHKIVFDTRYLLLSSKERKHVFQTYISKQMEKEKNDRQRELQLQKESFFSLLKEAGVNSKSRFIDIAKQYEKDVRFKSIEKIRQRENLFNRYTSKLIKEEKEREKMKIDQKKKFLQLLREQNFIDTEITWAKVQEKIFKDERYKAIESNSAKEEIFKEYIESLHSDNSPHERDRVSTSIRNREKEVKRELSVHLRDREREQELHKNMSATSDFKALLNDLIRKPDICWHSAKKIMKKDHRWSLVQCLESENLEKLFNDHIYSLNEKKREEFHQLLDKLPGITFKTSWLDVRRAVLKDPKCSKFSSSERKCEKEFKDYIRRKFITAKAEFRELLCETKIITYKSKSLLSNTNHLKDIEETLSQDKRYLNLDCMRNDRREIILSYINKLDENGPPPPPTATNPSELHK